MQDTITINLPIPWRWNMKRKRMGVAWKRVIYLGLIAVYKERQKQAFWRLQNAKDKT